MVNWPAVAAAANVQNPGAAVPVATRRWRRWLRVTAWAALLLLLLGWAMGAHVVHRAAPWLVEPAEAPLADCIVVPGARIHADGTPYPMLVDRLEAALDLYVRGRAARIVLSGRGGGPLADDEVGAMRRWLLARGVPATALVDDALGLRTVQTMRRARQQFGMRSALVVSNGFHLSRAVFLAQHCGLEVHGVAAPALADYGTATLLRNHGRELLARVVAWLEVHVGAPGGAGSDG